MDAVARYSLDGTILFNSAAISAIIGYTPAEMVGTSGFNYVHPDDRSYAQSVLTRIVENGESGTYEGRLLCKDGQYKWVEFGGRAFLDNLTGCMEIIGVIRDISKRKKMERELRERKEFLKTLANSLPGVIYQFFVRQDGDMGFHYISERAVDVLGVDNNLPDIFKRVSACIPEEDRSRFVESIHHAALTVSRWEYEGRFITPAGEEKYVRGVSIPEQRPGEVVFNGMVLDITEQKRA
jgi:PAS domain S-box-containing protein